ncbi:hypothetical protein Acr_29g0007200 [Actinidia rufa]|uniref:Aminotransferase-like plant mobile domain-containing protein n=1 Tax=Actinidia rufa TaxID=165716 RepID=A0A7J0HEU0_9ERIC|nr:hypothetical protein Acr_29g0007200 [Actinidia rufa]
MLNADTQMLLSVGARWCGARHITLNHTHIHEFYRDELDAQQPHKVIWMPYTEATIIASSPARREAFDLWLARIPLHCFDIVEMHFPDRVMRQFGLSQHIPDYVVTGDELHDISRQGRSSKLHEMVHVNYAPIYYTYFVAFYNMYTYSSDLRARQPRQNKFVYYLLWEACKAASTLREGGDEMGHAMGKITLDLCHRGLQETGESEHLGAALVEDEIAFQERG